MNYRRMGGPEEVISKSVKAASDPEDIAVLHQNSDQSASWPKPRSQTVTQAINSGRKAGAKCCEEKKRD